MNTIDSNIEELKKIHSDFNTILWDKQKKYLETFERYKWFLCWFDDTVYQTLEKIGYINENLEQILKEIEDRKYSKIRSDRITLFYWEKKYLQMQMEPFRQIGVLLWI